MVKEVLMVKNSEQNDTEIGDSGDIDHLIPEQIDQVIVWRKTEQISWRSF